MTRLHSFTHSLERNLFHSLFVQQQEDESDQLVRASRCLNKGLVNFISQHSLHFHALLLMDSMMLITYIAIIIVVMIIIIIIVIVFIIIVVVVVIRMILNQKNSKMRKSSYESFTMSLEIHEPTSYVFQQFFNKKEWKWLKSHFNEMIINQLSAGNEQEIQNCCSRHRRLEGEGRYKVQVLENWLLQDGHQLSTCSHDSPHNVLWFITPLTPRPTPTQRSRVGGEGIFTSNI